MNSETQRKRLYRKKNPYKARLQNKKLTRKRLSDRNRQKRYLAKKALEVHARELQIQKNREQYDRELQKFYQQQQAMLRWHKREQSRLLAETYLNPKEEYYDSTQAA